MQKPSVPAGGTAQASATGATLEIIPQEPTRNSILTLEPKGFDLSQAAVEWLVNGGVVSGPGQYQLKVSEFSRGDTIQARVKLQNGQIYSNSVQIKNTPPVISSIKWEPEIFKPGDTVGVEAAATDVDGDAVTLLYEWTRNGVPAGKGKNIEGSVKRGDVISVRITPFDGEDTVKRRPGSWRFGILPRSSWSTLTSVSTVQCIPIRSELPTPMGTL